MSLMIRGIGNSTDLVNGFITGRNSFDERSFYRSMDDKDLAPTALPEIYRRIKHRLDKSGLKAATASRMATGNPEAIRNIERAIEGETGRVGVSTDTLAALAPVLGTTASWLLEERGQESLTGDAATIPVLGMVGAGGEVRDFHAYRGSVGQIPASEDATITTGALHIVGSPFGALLDGWFVIFDDLRIEPPAELIGTACVTKLADGRIFVRKLEKGRGARYTLQSSYDPPIYDVVVEWLGPVRRFVPEKR